MADEDEPADAFAGLAKCVSDALGISAPPRHPAGDNALCVRGHLQCQARCAALKLLLPHRYLVVLDGRRNQNDELARVMRELFLLLVMRFARFRILRVQRCVQ